MGPPPTKTELVTGVSGGAALLEASSLEVASARTRRNPLFWLVFLILALVLHFGVLPWVPWPDLHRQERKAVKINTIDPAKLEAIRRKWKQATPLLNPSSPRSETAPPDAKFSADRNIRVEKEQRAAMTDVLPSTKPGLGNEGRSASRAQSIPLRNLALPLPLDPNPNGWRRRPVRESSQSSSPEESEMAGGPDQSIQDDSLAIGSQNLLNAQESVHYSYYSRMYRQIAPIWRSGVSTVSQRTQPGFGDYVTEVDVVFKADGTLKEVRILRGSGITAFDNVVVTSWEKIAKVPNPPRELIDENGEIHTGWSFTVRVDAGFGRGMGARREY